MMQSEKRLNSAVLLYIFSLIILVFINILKSVSIIDVVYLLVLICSILKIMIIMHKNRK